jgi:acetyl-CoA acetyltransferase
MKPKWQARPVFIAGIHMTKWGFYPEIDSYVYSSEAIHAALRDAGMDWRDVQAVFSGSVYQGTASGHKVIKEVGRTGIPIVNVENACSSSSSALRLAFQQVAAGISDVVVVLGMEKNPRGPIPSTAFRPWELQLGFNFHPANYAIETSKYMARSGATEADISLVTVKNRRHAAMNPNARFQTPVTLEEVIGSRMVAPPLKLLHCCPLADGAAAAVICSGDKLRDRGRAVSIAAAVLTSAVYGEEYIPGGTVGSVKFPPEANLVELSARQAYDISGYGPEDMDVVQAYDTVSPSELWDLEELGFCGHGEAPRLLREGVFDLNGRIPVNTDGGLMGRGHPMGATGLGQIAEIVFQLRGEAGPRQVENARTGLAHAMGAGPNSSVTILTR